MPVPCRSCGAEIVWRVNAATGRPAPIDPLPDPDGNIVLEANGRYRVLSAAEDATGAPRRRYTSHFATCPSAAAWRGSHRE